MTALRLPAPLSKGPRTPAGLEGPQRAAVRPTWRANGLRTANYRRMTALERVMRTDRRRDGAGWAAGGGTAAPVVKVR